MFALNIGPTLGSGYDTPTTFLPRLDILRKLLGWMMLGLMVMPFGAVAAPIDRQALVKRHDPVMTRIDPHAPMMLGNGRLGFTAGITGLQTFPGAYDRLSPLLSMAQWAWHSFPNPHHYTEADGLVPVAVPGGGTQPYPWMRDWDVAKAHPAFTWLRENPHHFSLGRIGFWMTKADGSVAAIADISHIRQRLDLWTGALISRFRFDSQPVAVETRVHPLRDMVIVSVRSPLVASGRLGIDIAYPGVSHTLNPDPSDWNDSAAHRTAIFSSSPAQVSIENRIDETSYFSQIAAPSGRVSRQGPHRFRVLARSGDRLIVMVSFGRTSAPAPTGSYDEAVAAVTRHWRDFWTHGGMIDFSGSTDPRAAELERRVVLSQYLSAINEAGDTPPQEEGLFSNSWNGKFHLEMHVWHEAHFATWERAALLERSLDWYSRDLPHAQARAKRHGVLGAWWPKMTGPQGVNSPSTISPFIMWQQPQPIYLAELAYRANPTRETLARYGTIVAQTAALLAGWSRWNERTQHYDLGPPIIPVQENYDPLTTRNPAFELAFFRWGLETAQKWRKRQGAARDPAWDRVIARMAPQAERDGLYLPTATMPDFWRTTRSQLCKGHAIAPACMNKDHPSFLMAYGLIGGDRIDPAAMRATLAATKASWDWRQTWGWDFPMIAMTAARLGEPEQAIDWLFYDAPNNAWGSTGMTPRFHLDTAADTPTLVRDADTYFPSNGSLLLAVGMMAAGWDGSSGHAPGFPKKGWTVTAEGIRPLP